MSTLDDAIRENASGPKQVAVDGQVVVQHDPSELVEADRYLASKQAAAARRLGPRFYKLVPPGID